MKTHELFIMSIIENSFFFTNNAGQYLYGCSYEPENNSTGAAIIIVPPVGHERLRCYRESVNLARALAGAGFSVLRFDYRGEGESFGIFENYDVESRLEDISGAVAELKNRFSLQRVCLLGLRLGAIFSLMVAQKLKCDYLILCEPLFNTKKYARNLIRAHIIMVKEYYPDIKIQSADIRKQLNLGIPFSVYGFYVTGNYLQQLENIDAEEYVSAFMGNVCLVSFNKKDTENIISSNLSRWFEMFNIAASRNYISIETQFSWFTKKIWTDKISGLAEKIIMVIEGWNG
ncbi:MAG: alpha/beta hydrolase [Bacteroidales bacterium]|nr:alpha/beta hydrolase [Bacteroidales bacterium]